MQLTTNSVFSILQLFELHNLTPEQIAEQNELELLVVKSLLIQHSAKYREDEKKKEDEKPLVSEDELKEFMGAYKNIARYATCDHLKEKALKNLINVGLKVNDGLGVQDPRKLIKEMGVGNNVNILNLAIRKAREAKDLVKQDSKQIIDVQIEDSPKVTCP